MQFKDYLLNLPTYRPPRPSGDQTGPITRLGANENPLGPSPKALAAMQETLTRAHFYPDGGGYYLREAIAKKTGLDRANVILGCGSNEVIEFIGKAWQNLNTPFFLCLDEMNLAPVEEYFAEFLSAIESRSIDGNGSYETDPIIKPFKDFGKKVAYEMIEHLIGEKGVDIDQMSDLASDGEDKVVLRETDCCDYLR
jgi:hypothetical protein